MSFTSIALAVIFINSNEKILEFKELALRKLTMWIQLFIFSDNPFGKTLIIKASLRPAATGE